MSGDKRSVSTDALETLGKIIDDKAGRDAIHIAVEPVVAAEDLRPGVNVGILRDGTAGTCDRPLGIVDPFLKVPVKKGQRFWLLVYPRQITSLRHVWSHPSFADKEVAVSTGASKATSEQWLHDFIDNADCPDYDTVLRLAVEGRIEEGHDPDADYDRTHYIDGEYMHFSGMDAHGEIPPEFWNHVEIVTGKSIPSDRRASYFSCGC